MGHVLCPRVPGVTASRPSGAVEKLPQKSVTNKERKRKEFCLLLNEAKNGKRVWCGAAAEPSLPFPNGEDQAFPPAPTQNNFQNNCPPPACPFILALEDEKGCILLASLSCTLSEIFQTTGKEAEKRQKNG